MEESIAAEESPLFWQQHGKDRRSSYPSSLLLNPWFILLTTFLLGFLLLFSLPPLFSAFRSILRPNRVKRGWDTLNLFLVLFAIVCGILSRNTYNTTTSSSQNSEIAEENIQSFSSSSPQSSDPQFPKWLDQYTNRRMYGEDDPVLVGSSSTIRPLMRSSSSYPDLRQESLWSSRSERWQFSDDVKPDGGDREKRSSEDLRQRHRYRRRRSYGGGEDDGFQGVLMDKFVIRQTEKRRYPPPPSPAPLALPLPPSAEARGEELENKLRSKRQPPPPPPPPATPPRALRSEKKSSERKRSGGGGKEIVSAFAHLYQRKKKQKNKSNYDNATHSSTSYFPPPSSSSNPASSRSISPPPPPPPPPPAAAFFQNLFRKSSKSKKIHSMSAHSPPPPPPPPPPRRKRRPEPPLPSPPPPPRIESESPLVPMPPPPPPPPFRLQKLKFRDDGDYVRVASGLSDSSEMEFAEVTVAGGGGDESGQQSATPVVFPSPDVNCKADTFIARFKEGLRLEKMNSIREKEKIGTGGAGEHPGAS